MVFEHRTITSFLRAELLKRIQTNPSYSMRAFAKNLGLSPATLSSVLSQSRSLSVENLHRIGERLGLNGKEIHYLELLKRFESAKSVAVQDKILKEMEAFSPELGGTRTDLSIEHFRMISEWYHFALLECAELYGTQWDDAGVARNLGISVFQVKESMERLLYLELVEPLAPSGYRKIENRLMAATTGRSEAITKYHHEMFRQAAEALQTQPWGERFTGSETFAVSKEALEEIMKLTEQYLNQVNQIASRSKKKDRVYQAICSVFKTCEVKK